MGITEFFGRRKRRLLPGIQIPMHSEALMSQMRDTVAISRWLPIEPAHHIETLFKLLEFFPLLCGLLSELKPRDAPLFWETYGDWLLHKVEHPVPSFDSPRIGPAAHRADVRALKFATQHPWPASIWRDERCYRCFFKHLVARPLQLVSAQCAKHSCQSWTVRLLQDIKERYPGFSPRFLQARRSSCYISLDGGSYGVGGGGGGVGGKGGGKRGRKNSEGRVQGRGRRRSSAYHQREEEKEEEDDGRKSVNTIMVNTLLLDEEGAETRRNDGGPRKLTGTNSPPSDTGNVPILETWQQTDDTMEHTNSKTASSQVNDKQQSDIKGGSQRRTSSARERRRASKRAQAGARHQTFISE
ncbi:uncharacterized protein [Diadema setosum]|uniref:uncharacterized protein n=1 Tax=Diadema setosum TaxID=31175 RepID=UPI003B3B5DE8